MQLNSVVVTDVVVRTVVLVVSCVAVVVVVPVVLVDVVSVLVEASVDVWLLVFVVTVVTVVTVVLETVVVLFVLVSVLDVVSVSVTVVMVSVDVGRPCPAQSALSDEVPPMRNVWVLSSLGPKTSRLNPNCATFLNSTVAATFASWVFSCSGSAGQVMSASTDGEEKTDPPIMSSVFTRVSGVRKRSSKPRITTFSWCAPCKSMSKIVKKKSGIETDKLVSGSMNLASNTTIVPNCTLMLPYAPQELRPFVRTSGDE